MGEFDFAIMGNKGPTERSGKKRGKKGGICGNQSLLNGKTLSSLGGRMNEATNDSANCEATICGVGKGLAKCKVKGGKKWKGSEVRLITCASHWIIPHFLIGVTIFIFMFFRFFLQFQLTFFCRFPSIGIFGFVLISFLRRSACPRPISVSPRPSLFIDYFIPDATPNYMVKWLETLLFCAMLCLV